jgi:very-short-patch-repair endonuclease
MNKRQKITNHNYNKSLNKFASQLRKKMTKSESCLWKYVLRAGQMKGYTFNRQRPVLNYIADFMCKELMIIIELDGVSHHSEDAMKMMKKKMKTSDE